MRREIFCSFCGKEQNQAYKIIASPNGDAYICNECVEVCQDILKEKNTEMLTLKSPKEIKQYLDKFVVSQDRAKMVLSVAVYNHYKRIKYNENNEQHIDKSNILLCGPTGSGKTLLCKHLAEYLQVPFAEADATTLTEAGYVGDDVESVLFKLLQNANFDIKRAEKGIVYIDEIDKLAKKKSSSTNNQYKDPTGEGVQQGLLKIFEGKIATVPTQSNRKIANQDMVNMDTSQILFICGGAFNGIESIIQKRKNKNNLGFLNDSKQNINLTNEILPQDLIDYGLIPELIGRLPIITTLNELNKKDLERILLDPENSIVKQYKELFKLDGIELEFDSDILSSFADKAYNLKIGARGLKSIFENAMLGVMYQLPDKKVDKFIINRDILNQNKLLNAS